MDSTDPIFRAIFDIYDDAALVLSPDGEKMLFCNQAFTDLLGYSIEQLHNISVDVICGNKHIHSGEKFRQRITQSPTTTPLNLQWTLKSEAGEPVFVTITIKPISFDNNHSLGWLLQVNNESQIAKLALLGPEKNWRAIAENIPDIIMMLDRTGKILFVNHTLPGYQPDKVIGSFCYDYQPKEHQESMRSALRKVFDSGELVSFENVGAGSPGEWRHYISRCVPIKQAEQVAAALVIATDITEQKKAQQALQKSEHKFSKAFYSSPDAIIITRLADGKIIEVNEGFEKITGYSPTEAVGRTTLELNIWDNPNQRQEAVDLIRSQQRLRNYEIQLRVKSGTKRLCHMSVEQIEIEGVPCLVSVTRDVTEQQKAENDLRASQAFLSKAQEIAKMGSWRWNLDTNEVNWSDEMYRLYGINKQKYQGSLWDVINNTIHPDDKQKLEKILNVITGKHASVWKFEYRIKRPDGEIRHMWGDGEYIKNTQGYQNEVIGTVQDITEHKFTEEALVKSRSELEKRHISLLTINKIADRVYKALDLDTVAREAVQALSEYSMSPSIAFFISNYDDQTLDLLYSSEFSEESIKYGSKLPISGSLSGVSVKEKVVTVSENIADDDRLEPNTKQSLLKEGYVSAVSIPLLFKDNVLGIVNLLFKQTHIVSNIEYDTLFSIGKTIGLALGNARFVTQTQEQMLERQQAEETLRNIAIGVSSATGNEFFLSLVNNLANTFCIDYAFLGRLSEDDSSIVETIAVHAKGQIAENFTYHLKDTPCANVVNQDTCVYEHDVQKLFPNDQLLVEMGVQSYIGTPLYNSNRESLGLFVVLHSESLKNVDLMKSMLQIFAVRAAAELERLDAEHALRRSEEHLRLALTASNIGTWEWDITTNKVTWSKNVETIFHIQPGSFNGSYEDYLNLVYDNDLPVLQQAIEKSLQHFEPYFVEHRIVTKDNKLYWLAGRGEVYRNADGQPVLMRGTVSDITQRKETDLKLEASQKMLQLILDSIPARVFWKDRNSVYLGCNKLFAMDAGVSSAYDLIGKNDYDIAWRDQAEIYRQDDKQVIESGQAKFNYEEPQTTPKGDTIWLETSKIPLTDLDGNIIGILGTYNDITERKTAIEEKLKSQQKLQLHVQQTPLAVIEWNSNFKVVEWNPAAQKIFGFRRSDAIGKHATELIIPEQGENALKQAWQNLITKTGGQRVTSENVTSDGRHITCEWYNTVLANNEGTLIGVASAAMDITERIENERELKKYKDHLEELVAKRTDELTRVNKEMEAFSYSVSHDLRSPLRSIDGFSQILMEDYVDKLDDDARDYMQRVRSGAQRMAQLIDDLLKLSRLTRSELNHSEVDLSAIATEIVEKLKLEQPARSVEVHIQANMRIDADEGLLRVVLDNLLNNAWKYTSKEDHAVISFTAVDHDKEIEFCIEDTGVGFDMQFVGKLFGAFQRLHHADEFEGSGIGLATVARIIHRHGGRVWAEAKENRGAQFYFALPK